MGGNGAGSDIGEIMTKGLVKAAFVDTPWGWIVCGVFLLGILKEVLVLRHARRRRRRRRARR